MAYDIATSMLGDVLRNSAPLAVPVYQRGYSWEQTQVDDYVEDVNRTLMTAPPEEIHFMGAIVVVKHAGPRAVEIVDGQQRLATLSLAMAALSHGLESLIAQPRTVEL